MIRLEEPDTGYAWVIAFAACVINMILSGMARMIGILYVAIIETYGVSRQEASVPFTVRNAIRYLSGPVVGVLGQRYGIRSVTFFGGLIAALGSVLCCVAPTVAWISVFWGGIHGLGFSLGNTLFPVVVNQYFQKYRATASGIVLSGACVGSLAFPFMLDAILVRYGLFGCFLILGGIFLNVAPPSLVLKSPPWIEHTKEYARQKALLERWSVAPSETTGMQKKNEEIENHMKYPGSQSNCSFREFDVCGLSSASYKNNCPEFGGASKKLKFNNKFQEPKVEVNVICTSYCAENTVFDKELNKSEISSVQEKGINEKPSVPTYPNSHDIHGNFKEDQQKARSKSNSNTNLLEIAKNIALLYRNPIYILISVGVATYFWVFIPILTVVVDYSKDKGIEEKDRIYVIHALTVGDLFGRLCFGWVTDKGVLTFPVFMSLTFVFQGVFVSLLPFASFFWLYMSVLVLYGVTAGVVFVHFPVLVHKYVDEENQPIAMACVGLVSGVVSFGIPPLIGYFRDHIGSYDGLFYFIGLLSIITGVLWLLEPIFQKFGDNKKEKDQGCS